jgi:glycosyltransferase involved in cell wall biosynthesis
LTPRIDRGLRVLHAIHDFLPRHQAGSELYAAALCRELMSRHHITIVCADYDPGRQHGQLTWREYESLPVVEITNNWICASFADTYLPPVVSASLRHVLDIVQPHVVHVHNLLNLSFDLPAAARERGIPIVATLHDFTLVCPSGGQRIHRADSHVCHTIDAVRCARCFKESPLYSQAATGSPAAFASTSGIGRRALAVVRRLPPGMIQAGARAMARARGFPVTEAHVRERLAQARLLFDLVDLFVSPSAALGEAFVALGLDRSKLRVSDYGMPDVARSARGPNKSPLQIGFVGTLTWHKGIHVLLDALRRVPSRDYELQIHGDLHVFPEYVGDLRRRAAGLPVRFMGKFAASQTSAIYGALDVLVVSSIWLENSPLVIHEAFQAGVPVVGARIGGIADLITDGLNGRLYDPQSPDELARVLQSLIDNPAQLASWAARLPAVKSIAEDAREWERIYADLMTSRQVPAAAAR